MFPDVPKEIVVKVTQCIIYWNSFSDEVKEQMERDCVACWMSSDTDLLPLISVNLMAT